MATNQRSVQDLKAQITALKSITPWDSIEANAVYHIPPIITLERREILVLTKDDEKATYRRIGDKDQKERTMFKTSVFAKFIVKRKKY
jgi:hypothetical protein